jgi:hypothetical protein
LATASAPSAGTLSGLGTQFAGSPSIDFEPGAEWFISGNTSGLAGTISGFALGDTIELSGITATGSSYVGGILTLTEASGSVELKLPGGFTTTDFTVTNVAAGADVNVTCFRAGTRISTERGKVPVENLHVGETVVAHGVDGLIVLRPIVWIGYRSVDCKRHPNPQVVLPVRIRAEAFGAGQPYRDLFLSPDHAVFVDGALIPVKCLINGISIAQVPVDWVTYYHVELPRHDVLLAEGLPVESYLDTGDRLNFANGGGAMRLQPDFSTVTWEAFGCAPLIVTGAKLDAARARLGVIAANRSSQGLAAALLRAG